jgi:muconate cycloisomerase
MGMRQIKVKGCGAIESDLKSLSQIRRWMPPDVDLRLDLNGSLTPATANDYFSRLAKHHPTVTWIEQPFSKDAWIQSAALQRNFGEQFTFCADESVCTLEDLERAASTGAFRAINLRIAKHGGLVATQAIWRQARQLGLATQLGCLVGETTLLAAAGLHLAAATPHLRYHEGCFGRRLLAWDVVQPSLVFGYGGKVPLARLPSSGLTSPIDLSGVRRRAIKSFAVGKNS